MNMRPFDDELKIELYKKMVEIRCFEEASLPYFQKPGHGSHHPCIGNEAIEAAIGAALRETDYLFCSHRSHGHLLTKGLEPKFIMAELWGKMTGYCKGRGGSMHITSWSKRVLASGIVGHSITLAVGAALATKLRGGDEVAVAAFGDGTVNCGAFHEGLNMGSVWQLPVVFVCENNELAVSTHKKDSTSIERISERANAYSIPGVQIDGTDPKVSYEAVLNATRRARQGEGPSLIEAKVRRWRGHAAWDKGSYLSEGELEEMRFQDPLPKYRDLLVREGILSQAQVGNIEAEMRIIMEDAIRFAEESPGPALTKEEAMRFAFA
jgi:TPP-dependent pyruvate/acetoin dehydrogenase alpha subunit